MNYLQHFSTTKVVEACIAGAGDFGRGVLRQARQMQGLSARIAIDINPEKAAEALRHAGIPESEIMVCHSQDEAESAWQAGAFIATSSFDTVKSLPFDILVESTGIPDVGARYAEAALLAGKHVGIATKETESVVGPYLTRLAEQQGCLFTPLDGDQPSLLIGLVTWANTLGFEIISAGKSSEYDFIWDEAQGTVTCNGTAFDAAEMTSLWQLDDNDARATVQARSQALSAIAQISVPDLCEMVNVANATGLAPDLPEFHAMILRTIEVPTLLDTQEKGGVLEGNGRLEVFNCLRRPDELSFAGGVFVVVRCEDPHVWTLLRDKGHVLSRSGDSAMVYLPRHLLGLEAPISLLDVVLNGLTSGGGHATTPKFDLTARATQPIAAGQLLEMKGHHRHIDGLRPEIHPAAALAGDAQVPFYLLPGAEVIRDIAPGQPITLADVRLPASRLHELRLEQDALFYGNDSQ
ncbi:flagellar biosynthesis protein FlgA [Halomonas aquamarina]|uniref:Flagellar biosynthesis protein FlgA n=1 Tax=Vreelandella aquamarina TaxID=77097 RepID=A0ACC5VW20_9GAMM|nr:flagellar biosynthesis protein FlgA [Halomonas aquamarina]MBZ5488401.1 flagellar biosynthesis protein FlgA [Halomonas aquamarina]